MIPGFPVESSNVQVIGWAMNSLYVQFKHGGCYRYEHCTPDMWDCLQSAESKGSFINQSIKPKCTFTKLEGNPFVQPIAD